MDRIYGLKRPQFILVNWGVLSIDRVYADTGRRSMNILIDTNILIPLEDTGRILDGRFAELRRHVDELGFRLYIHPAQFDDLQRDRDQERRAIVMSRAEQYAKIPQPPPLTEKERIQNGWAQLKDNDRVDNLLLQAIHRGAAHILISNDEGIRTKATRVSIQERVYRLDQALEFLARQRVSQNFIAPFGIRERYLHEFNVRAPFFDSLREGYKGFDEWYLKGAQARRRCWSIANDAGTELFALCIFKPEESPEITDDGKSLPGSTLKLCTIKVGQTLQGKKIGERLLYTAFRYAIEHQFDWIYVHSNFERHGHLLSLCREYGFRKFGSYSGDEVCAKPMKPGLWGEPECPLEYTIQYHPFYRNDSRIERYIIPIQPKYHEDLFPDISDWSRGLFANDNAPLNPQSNTIKKAYICHSQITTMKPGDLVMFYRSQDRKSIEAIGVVESTVRTDDIATAMSLVAKRTVYSQEQLSALLTKTALIILFRLVRYTSPISSEALIKVGIKGAIQSIRSLSSEKFTSLFASLK